MNKTTEETSDATQNTPGVFGLCRPLNPHILMSEISFIHLYAKRLISDAEEEGCVTTHLRGPLTAKAGRVHSWSGLRRLKRAVDRHVAAWKRRQWPESSTG